MKKAARIIVIAVVILIALVVAGVFALNRYIQRPEFKEYVLAKTQEQLAVPLQVDSLTVSLFSGFELRGLVVKNPPGSQAPSLLNSKALVFRYRLWPLLHKQVAIQTIQVDSPTVVLEKAADGTWNYDKLTKPQPTETTETPGSTARPAKGQAAKAPPSGLGFEIANLALDHANVSILKPEGKKLLTVADLNVNSKVEGSGQTVTGKGELNIKSVSVIDSLEVSAIHSPIIVEQQQLKLPDLNGRIEDGTLKGTVAVDLQKEGYPYSVHVDVAKVDLGKLGAKFSDKAKYITGKLRLTTDVNGVGGDTNQLQGKGNAHVDSGTLSGVPLLQKIGSLLRIPELQQMQFDEITIEYAMDHGVIDTPVIKVMSKDIQLTGSGKTDFDFNLNHTFTLALSPSILGRVPKEVANVFAKRDDGFRTIDFTVTGPADSPKTDLTDRLVKGAANSLIEKGMGELLGGKKKKNK